MKKRFCSFLALTLGALAVIAIPLYAQVYSSGSAAGTTTATYVGSASTGLSPVVEYLSATSDLAGTAVQFYDAAAPILITGSSTGTNIVAVGSSFGTNDVLVARDVSTDSHQVLTVGSVVTATNITTTAAITLTLGAGDVIHRLTTSAKIPVGSNTISVIGKSFSGDAGKPLVARLTGTSACSINAITIGYN